MLQSFEDKLVIFNSTKKDGNVSIKFGGLNAITNNLNTFFNKINIDYKRCLFMDCIFKDVIIELDEDYFNNHLDLSKERVSADAVITRCKNVFIYEKFADCAPLIIYDKEQQILVFAHLGWQSIELNLHKKIVNKLINDYNSKTEDLIIYIGPSIKADSYILERPSQLKFEEWKPYLLNTKDNYYKVDLNGYLLGGLLGMGIRDNQISNGTIDTAKDMNYFSHYRCTYIDKNEEEGRFVCGAGMI